MASSSPTTRSWIPASCRPEPGVGRAQGLLDRAGRGVLDQVDRHRVRPAPAEGQAQPQGEHGREPVDPEQPGRLAVELAEPGEIQTAEGMIVPCHATVVLRAQRFKSRRPSFARRPACRASAVALASAAGRPRRDAVFAQVAAGHGDEDVFEADLPGRQPSQRMARRVQVVEQRGDRLVRLGDGQGEAVAFGSRGEDAGQVGEVGRFEPGRRRAAAHGELDDVLGAGPGDQVGGRAHRDHLALVDDGDPVAEPLGLVHVVRRQDRGPPPGAEVEDHVPELPPRLRVEPGRGLVEEQQLGVAHQGHRHGKPLLLAAGDLLDEGVGLRFERDPGQDVAGRQAVAVEAAEHRDQFAEGGFLREAGLLQRDADPLADLVGLRVPAPAQDLDVARGRRVQPFEDLDRGRLARAVGAEQAEAFARRTSRSSPSTATTGPGPAGVFFAEARHSDRPVATDHRLVSLPGRVGVRRRASKPAPGPIHPGLGPSLADRRPFAHPAVDPSIFAQL